MRTFPMVDRLLRAHADTDRALLARLRRASLVEGALPAYEIVAPYLGERPSRPYERAHLEVALLYGAYPGSPGDTPLPTALRRVADTRDSASVSARFRGLLVAHRDDLYPQLRHALGLVSAAELEIDWHELLGALLHWEHPDRFVQRMWAKNYWASEVNA